MSGARGVIGICGRTKALAAVAGMMLGAGCAETTRTIAVRQEVSRQIEMVPGSTRVQLSLRREGAEVVATVRRLRTQSATARVSGYEIVHTTSTMPAWLTVVGLAGLVAAGIGALFVIPPDRSGDSSGSTSSTFLGSQPELGWAMIGTGTVAMIPAAITWMSLGTQSEQNPFERREPIAQPTTSAGAEPIVGAMVVVSHGGELGRRATDAEGEARFNLTQLLPSQALYGSSVWPSIQVTAGAERATLSLDPLRQEFADREWNDLDSAPTPAGAARFRLRFPADARLADVARIEAQMQRSEPRNASREDWIALPTTREAIESFARREPLDVYVVEARCRLLQVSHDPAERPELLSACRAAIDSVSPGADPLEGQLYRRAIQARDDAASASAARAQPLSDASPELYGLEPARHTSRRGRGRREALPSGLEGRVSQQIEACRGGDRNQDRIRRAYNVLLVMRAQGEGARVSPLLVQLNLACGASPASVGINGL